MVCGYIIDNFYIFYYKNFIINIIERICFIMNIIEIASTLVENRRNSILSEVVKVVNNADDVNITRQYGYVDHRGIYNACVMIEGFPKPFRARSEIMIFKDGKLFIN